MLFSPVFANPHPRRFVFPSSRDLCVLSVSALDCSFSLVASNLQFSIEDPDSVGTFNFQPSLCTKSFSCNTYGSPHKCCKQKTYAQTKPFRCNTYKTTGGVRPNSWSQIESAGQIWYQFETKEAKSCPQLTT